MHFSACKRTLIKNFLKERSGLYTRPTDKVSKNISVPLMEQDTFLNLCLMKYVDITLFMLAYQINLKSIQTMFHFSACKRTLIKKA